MAKFAKNASYERILQRLGSLPWTLTRSASERSALRLVQLLEREGATTEVIPPLEKQRGETISQGVRGSVSEPSPASPEWTV